MKAHFPLVGMDVDVHRFKRHSQMQNAHGEAADHHALLAGFLQGGGEELAAHKSAIDEKELAGPGAAAV